jgi:NADPH:quinone reductase-like Zn-dependent oxidoreductase
VKLVRSLGADIVVDFTKEDFSQVRSGYDLVLDSVGGDNVATSLTIVKPGGLVIGVAGPLASGFARQLRAPGVMSVIMNALSRKVRKKAKALGVRYEFLFMQANGSLLRKLGALYDSGALRPVIDSVFPFEQTLEAMAYVERGRTKAGKVVVTMQPVAD